MDNMDFITSTNALQFILVKREVSLHVKRERVRVERDRRA